MYEIIGVYQGSPREQEVIDTADTVSEAAYLVEEYRLAYGAEWRIWKRKARRSYV